MNTRFILLAFIAGITVATPASATPASSPCPQSPTVRKTASCEISRTTVRRMGYDKCGRCYWYSVVTVIYRDSFSDGSHRVRSRSFRA
jgi:hypothetical protein